MARHATSSGSSFLSGRKGNLSPAYYRRERYEARQLPTAGLFLVQISIRLEHSDKDDFCCRLNGAKRAKMSE
jgi:hypothetical protein